MTNRPPPPYDETGEHGPRSVADLTVSEQHRAHTGPGVPADAPGCLVFGGGAWYVGDNGR